MGSGAMTGIGKACRPAPRPSPAEFPGKEGGNATRPQQLEKKTGNFPRMRVSNMAGDSSLDCGCPTTAESPDPAACPAVPLSLGHMSFTALHRAIGAAPGPLTDELLDAAVASGVTETNDLDWKSELPPAKGISQTDFPKDIAAMANSGGGVIVYGVKESQKAATARVDVGEFDEVYERSLRSAAITAVTPPVFGLNVHRLGDTGKRAVIIQVPASVDGPHLIYKNDYFGAPVRSDSDTVWMKERQIEAMYRARFESAGTRPRRWTPYLPKHPRAATPVNGHG